MAKIGNERMTSKDNTRKYYYLYQTSLLLFIGFVAMFFVMGLSRVESEIEFACNSGSVGLDVHAENMVQEYPCHNETMRGENNLTCFVEDLILKQVNIEGVEGLECHGGGKVKMPLLLFFVMT